MKRLLYLAVFLAGGCSANNLVAIDYDYAPPSDWPQLEERLTYSDLETTRRFCNPPKALWTRIVSCAVVSFEYGLCMIYLSDNDDVTLKHERAHCQGYSHVGENGKTHQAWEAWKRTKKGGLMSPQ